MSAKRPSKVFTDFFAGVAVGFILGSCFVTVLYVVLP